MFFGRPRRLGWGVGLVVVLIAAATAAAVVYLTGGSSGDRDSAAPSAQTGSPAQAAPVEARAADVMGLIPTGLRQNRVKQPAADIGAVATAVCLQPPGAKGFTPDRREVSTFANGAAVRKAYQEQRRLNGIASNQGKCNSLAWGGEGAWAHRPGEAGVADFATSTATTPSSCGRMNASARRTTGTSSPSPARAGATTRGCSAGGRTPTT